MLEQYNVISNQGMDLLATVGAKSESEAIKQANELGLKGFYVERTYVDFYTGDIMLLGIYKRALLEINSALDYMNLEWQEKQYMAQAEQLEKLIAIEEKKQGKYM